MKHIILDPQCLYDKRYCNYRFHLSSGAKTDYFKINEDVPINPDGTCVKNKFLVIKSSKSGVWQIVQGSDTSQRCLVMMSANPKSQYEQIEIDDSETMAQVLEVYDIQSEVNGLKIVCILAARKPLMVKFINRMTCRVRYEMSIYDAINEEVCTRELTARQLQTLINDTIILHDADFDSELATVSEENFDKWNAELITMAENHYVNYHSFIKDRVLTSKY